MTISHYVRVFAPLCVFALVGAGCLDGGTPQGSALDGGVFRTKDVAVTWQQLTALTIGGKVGSIGDVGTVTMAFDPQDAQAVYMGSAENGLFVSLDGGDSWAVSKGLSSGKVQAVSVDPKDKCTVYVAKANQVLKTANCGRDWNQVFFDERVDKIFTAVVVDWFNSNIVYAGTNAGDILRSDDAGGSWRVLTRIEGTNINDMDIDARDSRVMYVATNGRGIAKTMDSGATWTQIIDPFDAYDGANRPTQIVLDPGAQNTLYTVSRFGILKSDDSGASWRALSLPNPPNTVQIKSMAVHPTNPRMVVYATDTSIVFTNDGGTTWTSKKLPTKRGVSFIAFDRSTPPVLFLGAYPRKK
ncbi:MAG: YCF48-related protein [Patescibacteria group bacterium]